MQQVCKSAARVLSHRLKQLLAYASRLQHQPSRAAMICTNAVYVADVMACCVQVANLARLPCLPGLFKADLTHILRAFYSADIGINTASSCDGPTCFVSELVAGSASVSLT